MNFKKLSLAAILSSGFVLTGCPTDDTPGGTGDTDDTDPTTMTATMTAGTMTTMTGPTSGTMTGPSTTDPDTTDTMTDTDPDTDDTDSDTTGPDPDVYDFREDGADAYTAVDRMGFPAVNTALIASKDAYNASTPADDVGAGSFAAEAVASVQFLHNGNDPQDSTGLRDDFELANTLLGTDFTPCGVTKLNNGCFQQAVPLAFPDVILINTNNASGFPNGRDLVTPVIDVVLAALLLTIDAPADFGQLADLDPEDDEVHGLSQSPNDVAFPGAFPYLAPAHEAK